jgi:maltose alpha-D-glucosyltransferase / alpha-amylase
MEPMGAWYETAVFYEIYLRSFADSSGDGIGDLAGLASRLDYLVDLGVDCLWLLPIHPSPMRDDGYDVSDYCGIHPDYGSLEDFDDLMRQVHRRGLRLILDLVLNHTSDQHPWFQAARRDRSSPYRPYYVWSDDPQPYSEARIIFRDTQVSNWKWDPRARQYFWHRFYGFQPDLNFDHPPVQDEILSVLRFWLDRGVDGFRVDAVPYLFERDGTICENLPETHAFVRRMRAFMDQYSPGCALLAEANQRPLELLPYFGEGDEFHLAFHFPLMVRIFESLKRADRRPMEQVVTRIPALPAGCQWCTFLRNHDELTLEMVSEEERTWMWEQYAPEANMRLNLGIRRRLAPLLDGDRRKVELAHSLLLALPGTPVLYYGDEIGMGDDLRLPDRRGLRTPMQWTAGKAAGFSSAGKAYVRPIDRGAYGYARVNAAAQQADPESLWHTLRDLLAARKASPALLHGPARILPIADPSILVCERSDPSGRVLAIHNLGSEARTLETGTLLQGTDHPGDLLASHQRAALPDRSGRLELPPYGYTWWAVASG